MALTSAGDIPSILGSNSSTGREASKACRRHGVPDSELTRSQLTAGAIGGAWLT